MIIDEVQSGYGRSGKFFAHQYSEVRPDIITVAKGMGNGFPVGGVLIAPEIKPWFGMLGTTFGGNYLACAASIAVLDVMEYENLVENALVVGSYIMEQLKEINSGFQIRGRGLMIGLEFPFPVKEMRSILLSEHKIFTGISGTNTIRLLPPLCLNKPEADIFLVAFRKVLANIKQLLAEQSI
jgi:acetylornithine/N-succinyldiaminopimelate aminotransferase